MGSQGMGWVGKFLAEEGRKFHKKVLGFRLASLRIFGSVLSGWSGVEFPMVI